MTREERKLALYCLKASSDYHSEVCEECINHPNCDHTWQDDITETIIKALEQEPKAEKVIKMRDATPEERELIDKYIKSISKPTGVNFGALEQEPCEDAISRQAVKDLFCRICMESNICYRSKETCEDLKLFDKLPSVKPQLSEDAISRDVVIKLAYDMSEIDGEHFDEPCMVVDVEDIQKLPPVAPQRQTGHWIEHPKGIYTHLVCDKCLSNAPYNCRTNYCPNCGCRMAEPQERNDKE